MAKQSLFDAVAIDAATIDKQIFEIVRQSTALKRHIQLVAVGCALHAAVYEDIRPMQKLHDGLGAGWYRASLIAWALKNGPFGFKLKDKDVPDSKAGFTFDKVKATKLAAAYEADATLATTGLLAIAWEDAKKEPDFQGFDLLGTLKRAIATADKVAVDPVKSKHSKNKIDPDLLAAARKLVAQAALSAEVNGNGAPTAPTNADISGEMAPASVH